MSEAAGAAPTGESVEELAQLYAQAQAVLAQRPGDVRLSTLAGHLACRIGRPGEALPHLRLAHAATPDDLGIRTALGIALVTTGALDEARALCANGESIGLVRLTAEIDQRQGRTDAAIAGFRRVVAEAPGDAAAWMSLGTLLVEAGDTDGAIAAFRRGATGPADLPRMHLNVAKALSAAGRDVESRRVLREAARIAPADPEILAQLGLAEGALQDFAAAEHAYRAAIARDPGYAPAWIELGMLLEKLNRLGDLAALVADARAAGLGDAQIGFVEAWLRRREGRFAEALALVDRAGAINPVRHALLRGEIAERMGDADAAFAAYAEMNRAQAMEPASRRARAADYPAAVRGTIARLTPEQVASWSRVALDPVPLAPVFVLGFPRSGTTLLDTLLMNLPECHVLEELPVIDAVVARLGGADRIPLLDAAEANGLRATYFEALARIAPPDSPGQTIVDKFPLHMARMPIIHRLFPEAKVVMVERHPYDAVLSCFMANFEANPAMVQFQDLADAARLYDLCMEAWTRATALLPIRVHRVRYERMVEDLAGELRPLLAFLELPWRDDVLDNQAAARGRDHIRTASYAQVGEKLYARAVGRWRRYRNQLAPVLPMLSPWAERMGYER